MRNYKVSVKDATGSVGSFNFFADTLESAVSVLSQTLREDWAGPWSISRDGELILESDD
jgi:hypothetical protein